MKTQIVSSSMTGKVLREPLSDGKDVLEQASVIKEDSLKNEKVLETPKKWTVLLYLNGNNKMQTRALSTLRLSEFIGSSNDVNIVAQVSRNKKWYDFISGDWSGARRYYVTKNPNPPTPVTMLKELLHWFVPPFTAGITSKLIGDLGKVNMGDPETLKKSILDTMTQFPAQRYMVWMKMPSDGTAGFSPDTATGDKLIPSDLEHVLKEIKETTGKEIDVLTLEGSGTSSLEMAYQLKDGAKFLVGSQEVLEGAGFAVPSLLNEIVELNKDSDNPEAAPPLQVVQLMGLIQSIASTVNPLFSPAASAMELSHVKGLKDEMLRLSKSLIEAKVSPSHIERLISHTQGFGATGEREIHKGFGDLYHFVQLISEDPEITSLEVKDAAKGVMEKVRACVVSDGQIPKDNPNPVELPGQKEKPDYSNANGLSVNLDTHYGFASPEKFSDFSLKFDGTRGYDKLAFTLDTGWDKLLTSISKEPAGRKILRHVIGEDGANLAKGTYGSLKRPLSFGISSSQNVGNMEAYSGWKAGKPADIKLLPGFVSNLFGLSLIGIPGLAAARIGIIGGITSAAKAFKEIVKGFAIGKKKIETKVEFPLEKPKYVVDEQKITDGTFNLARGLAVAGTNTALAYSKYAGLLNPLGYLAWGIPFAQVLIGVYRQFKASRPKANMQNIIDPLMTKSRVVNTCIQYLGKKAWD